MSSIIVIPSRLGSVRLPNKPLADINGEKMVIRVMQQAQKANIADVVVACCEEEVAELVSSKGGNYVMTDPELPSGTDRVAQAVERSGKDYDYVMNLQGDLPNIEPKSLEIALNSLIENQDYDISTIAAKITDMEEINIPSVVKIARADSGRALYFSRTCIPYGTGQLYHHVGVYCYRKDSLNRFVNLPVSNLEKCEKLEQLRALSDGMSIYAALVDQIPVSVDTAEDLEKVRRLIK